MEPREIIQATSAIGTIGASFYFAPATVAAGKERFGIDGFRFYFLGRGGVLGDVHADVVRSAFGYFEPGLLAHMWNSGRERVAPHSTHDVAREFIACAHRHGRERVADSQPLADFVAAAGKVIAAPEGASMALFAALRAEPVPADAPAAALHQAMVLRELRGSAHLLALAAVGLPTAQAHAVRRPDDTALFGYQAEQLEAPTDADRDRWEQAEQLTDRLLLDAYAALDRSEAAALVVGTELLAAALAD